MSMPRSSSVPTTTGSSITANCLHPGGIQSNLGRGNGRLFDGLHTLISKLFLKPPEEGARTSLYLAASPEVEGVTGRKVEPVVGKPSPITLAVALERLGLTAGECAVVGDRLETDIAMGKAAGLATILVLTGVTRAGDPAIARWKPDHVLASLADLVT